MSRTSFGLSEKRRHSDPDESERRAQGYEGTIGAQLSSMHIQQTDRERTTSQAGWTQPTVIELHTIISAHHIRSFRHIIGCRFGIAIRPTLD
jgi:hypothetical protein